MPNGGELSHWANPSLYVSGIALFVSVVQAIRSIRSERKNDKRVQFIEFIAGEFAKCEASLDVLESKLRRGLNHDSVTSADVLEVALPAGRTCARSMRTISEMRTVTEDLVVSTNVDQLDEIWVMADEGEFENKARALHFRTAIHIVTRVSANMASAKAQLTSAHL